ncbi:hypothetical protein [Nocardioides sp.]|uniref:hypothetical protein n=1 Tax=Nocardioides sp. TaxID=35761 RepID=UPI00261581B8|nr:hypothetical protein [Nocardioides sp.]MDI6912205.1 hypothetical protein [Nocardioides sp.]
MRERGVVRPPAELAAWFTHRPGCADPEQLGLFEHRDGTPGLGCASCGRSVPLRGSTRQRAVAEVALRREAEEGPAVVAVVVAARYVLTCIDCGSTIPVHRGDRPVVPLCQVDRARRQAEKAERLRRRREAQARDEARG